MKATTMTLSGKRQSVFPLEWCKRQGLENGGTLNVFEVGDALVIEPVKPLPYCPFVVGRSFQLSVFSFSAFSLFLSAFFSTAAMNYETLLSFGAEISQGRRPYSGIVIGQDGALYGTTIQGGTNSVGTVFKLNADGTGYTLLHTFLTNGIDGQSPVALLQASDGILYGTTSIGGTNKAGTVYRLNTNGSGYTLLHTFGSIVGDAQNPQAGLIEGADGALYSTAFFGGAEDAGAVFKLTKDGSGYRVLYSFSLNNAGGINPDTALIQGLDGALYGTTFLGGPDNAGTVFKMTIEGTGYAVLQNFTGANGDGKNPDAALLQAGNGFLYGTTYSGGSNAVGTIFNLTTNGASYAVLHHFGSAGADGRSPLGPLLQARDGALYGTTYLGGVGAGVIFKLALDGTGYAILNSFSLAGSDGQNPRSGLAQAGDDFFYGTTWVGGAHSLGTVFRFQPPGPRPTMIDAAVAGSAIQVRFSGIGGNHYELFRSTNLVDWISLTTLTMPASGVATNLDVSPPPGLGLYRASWVP